tara:strand:- start:2431 stop:4254 length:1824 start_codon:yes stop_codon:yes gene_type:complete
MNEEIKLLEHELTEANAAYRAGKPIISDAEYDVLFEKLFELHPTSDVLHQVEAEPDFGAGKVVHKEPMLSTEKAYEKDEMKAWVKKVLKAAQELVIPLEHVVFRASPKLDGMAGKLNGATLTTRGDGLVGNDVTACIKKGVRVNLGNPGVGEIVMTKHYFDAYMSDDFSHPRNVVVGAVGADEPNPLTQAALDAGAIGFVRYDDIKSWQGSFQELLLSLDEICDDMENCEFPVDGTVIEVINVSIKEHMGSGSHHHNWQIAKKRRGESKQCKVEGITWQVGRTGRVTPVINIEPTLISGANISNVTGHHAGNIKAQGVGVGAVIEVVRSGEVIPFMAGVVKPITADIPTECPCCSSELKWDNDFLICDNISCTAQVETKLLHWFKTMGNVDGFGPSTIEKLVAHGVDTTYAIYKMDKDEYQDGNFGAGQAANLLTETLRSTTDAVNDWRFLASFGIHHMGRGDSKKLLKHVTLENLSQVTEEFMLAIDGFGPITAASVSKEIVNRWEEIENMLGLNFNIIQTMTDEVLEESPITGRFIVFTGGMVMGTRDTMKESAEKLGATPQSSINKKTNILVIGNKASQAKIEKAAGLGAEVITEEDYYKLIGE